MISSEFLSNNQLEAKKSKFPLLARFSEIEDGEDGFVVLFNDENSGMVVHDPDDTWGVGYHSNTCADLSDADQWQILEHGEAIMITQD